MPCRSNSTFVGKVTLAPHKVGRWSLKYRVQISRAGTSNYIPQYLWFAITKPYLLLVHKSMHIWYYKMYTLYLDVFMVLLLDAGGVVHLVRPSILLERFMDIPGDIKEWMTWNYVCWCILTTSRTDKILVKVRWFTSRWCHFGLIKHIKFGVSWRDLKMHKRKGLQFDMLMYPDHRQNR